MSDSVDPMNSSQPLGEISKPVTSMPPLAKVDPSQQKRPPAAGELKKIRSSHPRSSRMPDAVFRVIILLSAISVFAIVVLVVWELVSKSQLSLHQFGIRFFWGTNWDPVNGDFGALPFIFGTLVSSLLSITVGGAAFRGSRGVHHRNVPRVDCAPSSPSWLSFWLRFQV